MFSKSWEKVRPVEAVPSPLTHMEKSRIEHEALHAAATKGGLITLRGREMQAKTSFDESRRSAVIEGLLWQISEQVTRRAQVTCYRDQGLSKHAIVKAVWHAEEGPLYEQACVEYEEIVSSLRRKG